MYRKFGAFNAGKRAHPLAWLLVTTSLYPLAVQAQPATKPAAQTAAKPAAKPSPKSGGAMALPTVEVTATGGGGGGRRRPAGKPRRKSGL